MIKVSCFIASSLDGFIAGTQDELDWLFMDQDYGYDAFYASVDCILMGAGTYEIVSGFGDWPYPDKPCWVFSTHALAEENAQLHFVHDSPEQILGMLEQQGCKHAWLVGGGALIKSFRRADLIDEYILSLHPVLLGEGKPLFANIPSMQDLALVSHEVFDSGLVQLTYRRHALASDQQAGMAAPAR